MAVADRVLGFAGSAVAIEWEGEEAARLVSFLFEAVPVSPPVEPHITFHLESVAGENEIRLTSHAIDENAPAASVQGAFTTVALQLMEQVTYHLADRSQGGSLFHAACLSRGDQAVLLPGASGCGKSSLAIWLAGQGFQYQTDELAFIPAGAQECQALPRPVHLKPSGAGLFPDLLAKGALPIQLPQAGASAGWLVPSASFAAVAASAAVPAFAAISAFPAARRPLNLSRIIFPQYQPGADFTFQPLSKASAARCLAALLVNARNLPDNGFPELLRLARAIPAWQLVYGSYDQIPLTYIL